MIFQAPVAAVLFTSKSKMAHSVQVILILQFGDETRFRAFKWGCIETLCLYNTTYIDLLISRDDISAEGPSYALPPLPPR